MYTFFTNSAQFIKAYYSIHSRQPITTYAMNILSLNITITVYSNVYPVQYIGLREIDAWQFQL